jgi:hypothetical protein
MWEMIASSVIARSTSAIVTLSTIAQIHKYRRLHKGHHFIPMAMKVHGALGCDMYCLIKECVHLFHDRRSRGHLFLSFCIQFFKQRVSIALQRALPLL